MPVMEVPEESGYTLLPALLPAGVNGPLTGPLLPAGVTGVTGLNHADAKEKLVFETAK